MNEIIAATIKEYRKPKTEEADDTSTWFQGNSAKQNLIAEELPKLYKRFPGEKFGFSKGEFASAQNDTGARWVNMCSAAIGLREMSPSNIESYHDKAKKRPPR